MDAYVGSSGFSYDFWRGSFYPEDLPADGMLGFYAASCRAVEINNTFYRMPKADVMRRWAAAVPAGFRFAIKASRRITHMSRLKDTAANVAYLHEQLAPLGHKLGPVLYQLPPNLKKNAERLRALLAVIPAGTTPVLEFRHASWFDDEISAVLRDHGAVLCASDEDAADPPLVRTTSCGYLRLRAPDYDELALRRLLERAEALWPTIFVFFKHEENAPALIERTHAVLAELASARAPARAQS